MANTLSRAERALTAAALVLVALIFALAVRRHQKIAGIASAANNPNMDVAQTVPFFTVKKKFGNGSVLMGPGRRTALPFSFISPKPASTYRIFIVGPSVAQMLTYTSSEIRFSVAGLLSGVPRFGGINMLAAALRLKSHIELINCGVPSYTNPLYLTIVKEVVGYQPDMVIILSGNHERATFYPRTTDEVREEVERREAAGGKHISAIAGETLAALGDNTDVAFNSRQYEHSLRLHREYLMEMTKLVKSAGATPVLATLPANQSDFPPSGIALPLGRDFTLARLALETRGAQALPLFKKYTAAHPKDAFAHYYLGKCYQAAGQYQLAKDEYLLAIEYDYQGDRCSKRRNDITRRIALEQGVVLADLEKAFAGASPDGIVGGEFIADAYHWHFQYNYFVSWTLLEAALRGIKAPPGDSSALREEYLRHNREMPEVIRKSTEKESLLCYAVFFMQFYMSDPDPRRSNYVNEISLSLFEQLDRRGRSEFLSLLDDNSAFKKTIGRARAASPRPLLEKFRFRVLATAGELYRRQGEKKLALAFYDKALAMDRNMFVLAGRGLCFAQSGDKAAAGRDFAAALAAAGVGPFARKRDRADFVNYVKTLAGAYLINIPS